MAKSIFHHANRARCLGEVTKSYEYWLSVASKLNNLIFPYYLLCARAESGLNMEKIVKDSSTVKIPPPVIEDNGAVRMGYVSPPFPPVRAEAARMADEGKVRMGMFTPLFPAPAK